MNVRRWITAAAFVFGLLSLGSSAVVQFGVAQGLPDIVVTNPIEVQTELTTTINNLVLPTVEQGESATIIATISNVLPTPLTESFFVEFKARNESTQQEITLDASSLTCLNFPSETDPSLCRISGLAGVGNDGDSVEIRAELNTSTIPPDSQPYTILVLANLLQPVSEANLDNNTGEGSLLINERTPNLLILAEFSLSPASPKQGDLLNVQFTIENDRLEDVNLPIDTSILIRKRNGAGTFGPSTTLVAPSLSCPNCRGIRLASGARATVNAQIVTTLVEAGDYQMQIKVDSSETIEEFNETDNTLTFDFKLGQPPRNLSIGGARLFPQLARPNSDPLTLNFGVTNESFATASSVGLGLTLRQVGSEESIDLLASDASCTPEDRFAVVNATADCATILSIAPNQTIALRYLIGTALSPGDYELTLAVDPTGQFEELVDSDNVVVFLFTIDENAPIVGQGPGRGPELHPTSIDLIPTSPIEQGDSILIESTIKNSGNRDATDFLVRFSYKLEDGTERTYTEIETQSIALLKVGLSVDLKATLDTEKLGLAPGFYSIKVEVVSPSQIELDDENNSVIGFFTITQPAN